MKLVKSALGVISYLAIAGSVYADNTIPNPVPNLTDVGSIFRSVFLFLIGIVGGIAIIFIVIGGIRYILARGDMKATDAAKNTITAALIGLVIALLAVAIVTIVYTFLGVNQGVSSPNVPTTTNK